MVDDVSGLDHLEGETVAILADGNVLDTQVVTSGALPTSLSRPYGIIHIGLAITAQIECMDLDVVGANDPFLDRVKTVKSATVLVSNTRGLKVGRDTDNVVALPQPVGTAALDLLTAKIRGGFAGTETDHGRFAIVQDSPLPARVLGWVTHADIGGREA